MYIYLASSAAWWIMYLVKIGCSSELYGRRNTYRTGCPPGGSPSYGIDYYAIYETTAESGAELKDFEEELHEHFLQYRLMWERPRDSEWFNFKGKNPCDEVNRFMESRPWVKREVPLSEIAPPKRSTRYLRKQYRKNLQFIKTRTVRNEVLNRLQEPVISAIAMFMTDVDNRAGYVIAPCGSGKTVMSSKGIRGVRKCVICCPSKKIQNQWYKTLLEEGIFTKTELWIVGGGSDGTTDPTTIGALFENDVFCIISTYMSSHLLVDMITTGLDLLILDEAHHMAGIVTRDENGEGRTRRLLLKASDLGIKRLSLTYTPRFITDNGGTDTEYLTMDDDTIFGKKIAELKIRDLIRKGVLPDYRLWTLRDEARRGMGIRGKAECILEAWGATEIVRGEEKHILHHLVVFAPTTQDAKDLEEFFKANTTDTRVLRVEEGDNLEDPIAEFTSSTRAILVNCFVLNEGVDIPIANAVAITYPKQSRGQITQMVLRAGRWYEGKSIFHILIPTLGDEDLSGFEEVLVALASCDEQLRDEIVLRAKSGEPSAPLPPSPETGDTVPECIMIEEFEADQEVIKRCFTNIRKNLFTSKESRRIQKDCIERGIDTSEEYSRLRIDIPELPEDPRSKGMTWYDFLHPMSTERLSGADFVNTIIEPNKLHIASRTLSAQNAENIYDEWRSAQPTDVIARLPSVQHITDGYFGKDDTNFSTFREKFGKRTVTRRR